MWKRTEPTQRGETGKGSLPQGGFYVFSYWFTWVMLGFAAGSYLLCHVQAPGCVIRLENSLRPFLPPSAMAAVAELAGLPGVIFSGLLSRLGERICGVKMPELLQDKYPRFFRLCFGSFIILSLAAVLAGSSDLFWPAFYAFWGVLAATGCICRVCYVFLIKSDSQEVLALQHYKGALLDSRRLLLEGRPERTEAPREGEGKGAKQDWKFRQILHNTAEYARTLLFQEHKDLLPEIARMWMDIFSDQSMPEWDENEYFGPEHYIFQDCSLAASAWEALLPEGLCSPLEVKILHSMMDCLDESVSGQDEGRYVYNREVLILGLAQFLMKTSPRGDTPAVKRLCSLTYERQARPADQDLVCACLMMRMVEWLEDRASAEDDLSCAVYFLQPLLDKSILSDQKGEEELPLAEFLYCAGSIMRHAQCMELEDFFVGMQSKLAERLETDSLINFLCQKAQTHNLLACFLQRMPPWKPNPAAPSQQESPVPAAEAPEESAAECKPEEPQKVNEEIPAAVGEESGPEEVPTAAGEEPGLEEVPAAAGEEPGPEEVPAAAKEEPGPEEVPAAVGEEPGPEEVPAAAKEEPGPEEVPAAAGEEPGPEDAPAAVGEEPSQAAVGPDETCKKEV